MKPLVLFGALLAFWRYPPALPKLTCWLLMLSGAVRYTGTTLSSRWRRTVG